ncbi:hypothetical protein [Streptococcus sobrinus]|uniref:Uncharacterized protein n=1 Tax=Streptococcus sobrinus W1703 TaxID=1227275 RepID=U2IIT2_9STRE|nr:hypothetical protein [Streptococcus sobrinus]ERJ73811.1 hypothetical protein HMPREF1557_02108 [Streptococcus sobrinus W1703]
MQAPALISLKFFELFNGLATQKPASRKYWLVEVSQLLCGQDGGFAPWYLI